MRVCFKGQKGHKLKKVSQTYLPDLARRLTVNTIISLIFVDLPLNRRDSNNCKHLGSLQALHLDPRGSSPGTGGPAQLPLPHKSRSEREDYLLSARRDMATGILSDCFTLIIGTGWQGGEDADTYRKCSARKHDCGIKLCRTSIVKKVCIMCLLFLSFRLCRTQYDKSSHHGTSEQGTPVRKHTLFQWCHRLLLIFSFQDWTVAKPSDVCSKFKVTKLHGPQNCGGVSTH